MSVRTYPGATAFTRTPSGAHSAARDRVRWCTPAFEALYAGCHCGRLTIAADIDPTLTITPPPASTMCRPNTWQPFHTPVRLTVITSSHSSGVTSRAGRWMHVPALLTSTSTRPNASTISSAARTTDCPVRDVGDDRRGR